MGTYILYFPIILGFCVLVPQTLLFLNFGSYSAATTLVADDAAIIAEAAAQAQQLRANGNDGGGSSSVAALQKPPYERLAVDTSSQNTDGAAAAAVVIPPARLSLTQDNDASLSTEFVTSLNTPACTHAMLVILPEIAPLVVKEMIESNDTSNHTETLWRQAVEACHGPLPSPANNYFNHRKPTDLSLRRWYQDMIGCDFRIRRDPALPKIECREFWDKPKTSEQWTTEVANRFLESTYCVFHTQLQIQPDRVEDKFLKPSIADQKPGWKPKRVLLVVLTMGPNGAKMGCNIARTGLPRGWEIVFVTGSWAGLKNKYSYTRKGIKLVLENQGGVPLEDSLIVFADAIDAYVQGSPEEVVAAYLAQPNRFVFSGEHSLFPNADWPFGLTVGKFLRDRRFAKPSPRMGSARGETQYVNTGGWVADGVAGMSFLAAMANLTENSATQPINMDWCYEKGTDQFLGNAFHLRYSSKLAIDTEGSFIMSAPNNKLTRTDEPDARGMYTYCFEPQADQRRDTKIPGVIRCPAIVHFNGGEKESEFYHIMLAELVKRDPQSPVTGTATIVHLDSKTVKYHQPIDGCSLDVPAESAAER